MYPFIDLSFSEKGGCLDYIYFRYRFGACDTRLARSWVWIYELCSLLELESTVVDRSGAVAERPWPALESK